MIVGPSESGKSTLANLLNGTDRRIRKTQDTIYGKYTIDTPSVYLELPFNYKFLVATAQEANVLICIVDPTAKVQMYPPLFATSFNCKPVGIITKIDLATEAEMVAARKQMAMLGIHSEVYELNLLEALKAPTMVEVEKLLELRALCRI